MDKTVIEKVEDWKMVAQKFLDEVLAKQDQAVVLALSGDLGVGKTTFVQFLAKELGIEELVTSPTFTIMKRYETTSKKFHTMVHMDAYRLESESELEPLQFNELAKLPNTLLCIEWAEKIKNSLPKNTIYFSLEINKDGQHTIQKVS